MMDIIGESKEMLSSVCTNRFPNGIFTDRISMKKVITCPLDVKSPQLIQDTSLNF